MTTSLRRPPPRSPSGPGPAPPRRVVRALLAGTAAALALAVGLTAVLWAVTPPVGDLMRRTRAVQVAHHEDPAVGVPAPRVVAALVATEDSRFFADHGADPLGAARGVLGALVGDPLAGGAGLDQQLAKVLYVPRGDVVGKLEQVVVGFKIDAAWPKDEVLAAYLGSVYFGHGYWGVDAAARGYFGVPADRLDVGQAALLAGIVQAPSAYDPTAHLDLALQRRAHVLDRMVATGALTPAEAAAAGAAPLGLR